MSDWVETQVSIVANRCLLSQTLQRASVPSRLRNLSRCVLLRLRVSPIQFSKVETFCRFGLPKLGAWLGACKFFLFRLSPDMLHPVSRAASCRLSCESGLYSRPERVVQVFLFRLGLDMLRLVAQSALCRLPYESGLYSRPERVVQAFFSAAVAAGVRIVRWSRRPPFGPEPRWGATI